jgi:thimet oligopeptidase
VKPGLSASLLGASALALTACSHLSTTQSDQAGTAKSLSGVRSNALVAPDSRPLLPIYDAQTLRLACKAALDEAQEQLIDLQALPIEEATVESVLNTWDAMGAAYENVLGPTGLQAHVHPDARVRSAGELCMLENSEFETQLFQNHTLFELITAVETRSMAETKLRTDLLNVFIDSGVNLSAEKQQRVAEISRQIQSKAQEYKRRVREQVELIGLSEADVVGMSNEWLEQADQDEKGRYLLGFSYPEYFPFMRNAQSSEARQRVYLGFTSRGGDRNIKLMDEVMALRHEYARIQGYSSYAEFSLRSHMARKPAAVTTFLEEISERVNATERETVETLRRFKSQRENTALESTRLHRWDQAYYAEQYRKENFNVDQESLRDYFPTDSAIEWALGTFSQVLGVTIQAANVPVWDADVSYYDVFDTNSGDFLGGIYLDIYPRAGKYNHAAAFDTRSGSTLHNRTPISVLVTNFNRVGLTQNSLETLLHELGHVFHGVLSKTHFASQSGTNVTRDFVEAPSQMLEAWARNFETLAPLSELCAPNCPVISKALVMRLNQARNFSLAGFYARQTLYARFDMALAGEDPQPAMSLWKEMESLTPMGHVDGSKFPSAFPHIMGGYAAGYYGYMWSEVIALDLLSAFGENLLDDNIGRRYRQTILANGGQREVIDLIESFLGRPSSPEAFFRQLDNSAHTGQPKEPH